MLKEAKIVIEETERFYEMYNKCCYTRKFVNEMLYNNGVIRFDSILHLCDIIEKQNNQIVDLLQNKIQTQYIVATEETIERIKKEVERC